MVPWAALTGALYPTLVPWVETCTQSHWRSLSVWSRISACWNLFKKIMILHRRVLILLHLSSTDTHFLSSLNSSNHIIWDVLWSVLWMCVFQCFRTPKPEGHCNHLTITRLLHARDYSHLSPGSRLKAQGEVRHGSLWFVLPPSLST